MYSASVRTLSCSFISGPPPGWQLSLRSTPTLRLSVPCFWRSQNHCANVLFNWMHAGAAMTGSQQQACSMYLQYVRC